MPYTSKNGPSGDFTIYWTVGTRLLWTSDTPGTRDEAVKMAKDTLDYYRETHPGMKATIIEHTTIETLT